MNPDPGNQWAEKPLSVRLRQVHKQWLNLGERQLLMLDNFILSAEYLEEQLAMKNEPSTSPATKQPSLGEPGFAAMKREQKRRVAFETWLTAFDAIEFTTNYFDVDPDTGYYIEGDVQRAWAAWQAAGEQSVPSENAELPKDWLDQWSIFAKDYNRYVEGDPKMPFSLFRESLTAFVNETDLMQAGFRSIPSATAALAAKLNEIDAARYRWLRTPHKVKHREDFYHRTCWVCSNSEADLDEAVDKMMAEDDGK